MPCRFTKILVLMKYFKFQCSKSCYDVYYRKVCVCAYGEHIRFISASVRITENTAQAKTDNRDQDVLSVTQNSQDISFDDFKLQ